MTLYVAPIVEGHTEQACLERLLHRIWNELLGQSERLQVLTRFRGKRGALIHPDGRALDAHIRKAFLELQAKLQKNPGARGLILILLDAEKDCPAELAPRLLETAKKTRSDASIACVIAKRMLENWIVAGASTLAGLNDLPDPLPGRDQFEERSGAAWLEKQLRAKSAARRYKKTVDAKVFVQSMNLTECRANAPSFDKLCRELENSLAPRTDSDEEKSVPE